MSKKDLHNISSGFKTPDNYFNSIEDRVFNQINTKSPLDEIKATGFSTPNDYFNSVEENILSKIEDEKPKVISLFNKKNLLYVSSIAAALVLMFNIFIPKEETQDVDAELVEFYLLEEQNLNSYELADLLSEAEFLDEDFTVLEDQINESDLESYLLDNVNIEDIIEQ